MLRDAPLTARSIPELYEWMRSVNDTLTDIAADIKKLSGDLAALSDRVETIEESI